MLLIILCVLFPPAIPFVIVYYLCGGNKNTRKTNTLIKQQTDEYRALTIATMSPAAREDLAERARAARARKVVLNLIAFIIILIVVYVINHQ